MEISNLLTNSKLENLVFGDFREIYSIKNIKPEEGIVLSKNYNKDAYLVVFFGKNPREKRHFDKHIYEDFADMDTGSNRRIIEFLNHRGFPFIHYQSNIEDSAKPDYFTVFRKEQNLFKVMYTKTLNGETLTYEEESVINLHLSHIHPILNSRVGDFPSLIYNPDLISEYIEEGQSKTSTENKIKRLSINDQRFYLGYKYQTLLDVCYHYLLILLTSDKKTVVRLCKRCGERFEVDASQIQRIYCRDCSILADNKARNIRRLRHKHNLQS